MKKVKTLLCIQLSYCLLQLYFSLAKLITVLLAAALVGLGYGTASSSVQAISVKVSPKHRVGLAISTNFIFQDLGVGIGPFLLGYFVPLIGYSGLYMMMTIVLLACIFLYYLLHGRKAIYVNKYAKSEDSLVN